MNAFEDHRWYYRTLDRHLLRQAPLASLCCRAERWHRSQWLSCTQDWCASRGRTVAVTAACSSVHPRITGISVELPRAASGHIVRPAVTVLSVPHNTCKPPNYTAALPHRWTLCAISFTLVRPIRRFIVWRGGVWRCYRLLRCNCGLNFTADQCDFSYTFSVHYALT